MQLPKTLVAAVTAACLCAVLFAQQAVAGEMVIKVIQPDVSLLRSPDLEGEVIRTTADAEEFITVTTVNDFYLVKDPETGSFLYLHFSLAEVLLDEVPEGMLISGQMQPPDEQDLSYWQVAIEHNDMRRMKSQPRHGMLVASNGKEYPAKYDYQMDYKPQVDGRQLVADAQQFLGTKYVLGGTDTSGIDCSGLTKVCLAAQGIEVEHRSSLQALEGRYVPHTELEVGDLVYFRDSKDSRYLSHVGIYLGNGKFIHSSQSAGGVVITSLSSNYFKSHYAFARRM